LHSDDYYQYGDAGDVTGVRGTTYQSALRAADIAHFQRVAALEAAAGISTGAREALRRLGVP